MSGLGDEAEIFCAMRTSPAFGPKSDIERRTAIRRNVNPFALVIRRSSYGCFANAISKSAIVMSYVASATAVTRRQMPTTAQLCQGALRIRVHAFGR
jgi:hypothetical protein